MKKEIQEMMSVWLFGPNGIFAPDYLPILDIFSYLYWFKIYRQNHLMGLCSNYQEPMQIEK